MPTVQTFRTMLRRQLADNSVTQAQTYDPPTLDEWRDDEVKALYSHGLFVRSSTRTLTGWTEPTVANSTHADGTKYVDRYLAMPTGFRRVHLLEFVDIYGHVKGESINFTDTEDPGFVRIDDLDKYVDLKVRMHGEREYTGVDDAQMKQEVVDVVIFGVVMRAISRELVDRNRSARSQIATRTTDISPGALTGSLVVAMRLFNDKVAKARNLQAIQSLNQ